MSSRTLDFSEQVRELTGGRGVDVVLNSLNGEFIPKSLQLLAAGGRYVEIGKLGIWSPEQVAAVRPDVSYFAFDLSEVPEEVRSKLKDMLATVMDWMAEGEIAPVLTETFQVTEVVTAFRQLAQAKNVGKLVVQLPRLRGVDDRTAKAPRLRGGASYLVTGALGGLGIEVAEWLIQQGARRLFLLGRRAPSAAIQEKVDRLAAAGVHVEVLQADVTDRDELGAAIRRITESGAPLAGVIHAAGVLDDAPLLEQTPERFSRVMAPKVTGLWNLHCLTRDAPLDLFVAFSSATAALGWAGQSNYGAANAFMDALMELRRAQGLPGISVGWGPWSETGMAARLPLAHRRFLTARGLRLTSTRYALAALDRILDLNPPHIIAAEFDWPIWLKGLGLPRARLYEIIEEIERPDRDSEATSPADGKNDLLEQLYRAPSQERQDLLMKHVRGLVSRLLGFSSVQQIEPRHRFFDLGIDSLGSVELKNRLQATLRCALPATYIIDHPTLESLVNHLHDKVLKLAQEVEPASPVVAAAA
jgi:myxalamid-type polyketide synthase MxaB